MRLALAELREAPPDVQRAASHVIRAVQTLEDVWRRGLLDAAVVRSLLNRLTGVNWLLARQAIDDATSRGVSPIVIALANQLVRAGDAQAAMGEYVKAATLYWATASLTGFSSSGTV